MLEGFKATDIYPLIPDALNLSDIAPPHHTQRMPASTEDPCSSEKVTDSVEQGRGDAQNSKAQLPCLSVLSLTNATPLSPPLKHHGTMHNSA